MRRGWVVALSSLLLATLVTCFYARLQFGHHLCARDVPPVPTAATAQARAGELLGKPLEQTRALLGCD